MGCGKPAQEMHHIKHYAGNPKRDVLENMMPVCRRCHMDVHRIGLTRFSQVHELDHYLKAKGFFWCTLQSKWKHAKF